VYNSKANGRIERPHWDVMQMLSKCCGPHTLSKWYWFFWQVMWADRVTVRKRFGCSPFFMVTGAHPILLLDVQEATWFVKLPDRMLTTEELIGYRVRALAKHRVHVSAWKSSPKTGKRLRLDWTKTAEDRKFPGPSKTATTVRSLVSNDSRNFKTNKRPV